MDPFASISDTRVDRKTVFHMWIGILIPRS